MKANKHIVRIGLHLALATACGAAFAQGGDPEKRMLDACQALAKEINRSKKAGISLQGLTPLVSWHAACAERPPTGPGKVTALCEGKRVTSRGEDRIFFWQKSDRGKRNDGYFICGE